MQPRHAAGPAAVLLLLACVACDTDSPPDPAAFPATFTPEQFEGGDSLQLSTHQPDPGWTWNDPCVLKVGTEYWMYASATDGFVFPVRTWRLLSGDGIHWERNPPAPVLEDAAPGAWDAGGIETPSVVWFNGQWHLFYTGYPLPVDDPLHSVLDYRVGHAVSEDGRTFSRVDGSPMILPAGDALDPGQDWRRFLTAEPGAVVLDSTLLVYFTTIGVDADLGATLQVIGLTRSDDGWAWSTPEPALKPEQGLYPRTADWLGYTTPAPVVAGGRMHLFFGVAHQPEGGAWSQRAIHHVSAAGPTGPWTHDTQPLRERGDHPWAQAEIRSPAPLWQAGGLDLYVAGHTLEAGFPSIFGISRLHRAP